MNRLRYHFNELPAVTKVAVTWAGWATVCLTGYYFARIWAGYQRIETLKIREVINEEFGVKLDAARKSVNESENSKS